MPLRRFFAIIIANVRFGDVCLAKGMKIIMGIAVLMTAVFMISYQIKPFEIFLTIAITAATVSYHLLMRLFVGGIFNLLLNNKVDYSRKWFRVGNAEKRLYEVLKVKKWKRFFPTYDPNAFDKKQHSWSEIAQAMCQSELVHQTIVILSFLPILFSFWFGSTLVFVLTSILSALFDLMFVMIQRYNRPRVLKMINNECL